MPRLQVIPVGKDQEASQTESSPKTPRPKILSAEKSHITSHNESGPPTMMEFFTMLNLKFEELDRLLVRTGNKLNDVVKEIWNNNQRRAGLQQLQVQQPRFVVKADVLEDTKTRESRDDFAPDGRLGDISSDRAHDQMRLTSFGDHE